MFQGLFNAFKMHLKTNSPEGYVYFVDTTTKQNMYFKIIVVLIVNTMSLFSIHLLFKYLNE